MFADAALSHARGETRLPSVPIIRKTLYQKIHSGSGIHTGEDASGIAAAIAFGHHTGRLPEEMATR
jgi:hypothetical protein